MHISVLLHDRTPHDKTKPKDLCHGDTAKGKKVTYKLCSPTEVKEGDLIHATEGTMTVDPYGVGCLFDIVVLPPGK